MADTIWGRPTFDQGAGPAAGGNLYFQPGSTYGAPTSWSTSPVGGIIREQNPQLAYAQYGNRLGVQDNDTAFNQWFYQQFPRFQRSYGLATLENPMLKIDDFLATLPGMQALQQQFNMASPGARGLNYGAYSPGVRWISR